LAASSWGQVPDLLNALDAGHRSLGAGGSMHVTTADTMATYYNPAGLGYLDRRQLGVSYRNLPRTNTRVSGSFANQVRTTRASSGKGAISHLGLAFPLRNAFAGAPGTIGLSYTLGGYIDDRGDSVPGSVLSVATGLGIRDYSDYIRARANYFTVAYGRTNGNQNLSYGFGITYLEQVLEFSQLGTYVDAAGAPVTPQFALPQARSVGSGVGFIAGAQYTPLNNPNLSFGLSFRSQIDLHSNAATAAYYDKIPARLIGGVAYRTPGLRRRPNDYTVFGLELQHYFAARNGVRFDRDAQTNFGLGAEYNLSYNRARIPLRLGYQNIAGGGPGYRGLSGFTYGVGYRTEDGRYGVDLNYFAPFSGGARDFSLSGAYRF
jgi:hypothetical protein